MSQMKCLQVNLQVQTKLYWLPSSDAYNSTWLIYSHSLSQWMDDKKRPVIQAVHSQAGNITQIVQNKPIISYSLH